jgi:hypothetical protein
MIAVMVATGRGRGRRWIPVVAAAVALAALPGCTGEKPHEPVGAGGSVPLELSLAKAVGSLSREQRDDLQSGVSDASSRYVVTAFLGDYPREDFLGTLGSFTGDAARRAATDLDLLTAARFAQADAIRATRLDAEVVPFAPAGKPAGASARVSFAFDVDQGGEGDHELRLDGRLLLTPTEDGWAIFGYDVKRDDVPAAGSP